MATVARERRRIARVDWGAEISASANGIYTMWRRDLIRFLRDRSRIVSSLGQPLLFLFVFAVGLSPTMGQMGRATGDLTYVRFVFPGVVTMAVLFTSVFSAVSIVWDREFGFLKEVLVAPVPRWSVAVGKALGGSTTAVFQGLLMLLFAPLLGIYPPLPIVPLLVVAIFLTAFALSAFGLLIAANLKTMEGFQMVVNFLLMPMFFLSGALFPLRNLPTWLMLATQLDPVAYGVDAIRRLLLGSVGVSAQELDELGINPFGHPTGVVGDLAVLCVVAAVMISLAVRSFSRQE